MKKELIEIKTDKQGIQTVSARELHEKLGVTERFNSWFNRVVSYGFIENVDFTSVKTFTVVNNGAKKEIDEYFISIDMAKHICMLQRSEIGMKFRNYFIACEKELIKKLEEEKQFLKTRTKSKAVRNMFTDTLKNHGYEKRHEFIQTTRQMKNALGITHKKDEMTEQELQLILASETISALSQNTEYGYHEVNPVCVEVSADVVNLIEKRMQKRLSA